MKRSKAPRGYATFKRASVARNPQMKITKSGIKLYPVKFNGIIVYVTIPE